MRLRPPNLAYDPTAVIDHHRPDDRFIPVRIEDLVATLAQDSDHLGAAAATLPTLAQLLQRVITQETAAFERDLIDRHNPVNPDRDTIAVGDLAAARTPAAYTDLLSRLEYLLTKANFTRLSDVDVGTVLHAANTRGLRVRLRPERVQHLGIWVRGRAEVDLLRRTLRKPRGVLQRLTVYRRLVVVARLTDDPNVQLKMFKEIPTEDVEALLPHAEIRMTWYDRLKMMSGGAGVAGTTATKLLNLAGGALVLSRLLWVLLFGAGWLCVRTFFGYRNVRAQRDLQRTTNLYYQNLANNTGVIHALISMIGQEDCKEALLAYLFCWRAAQRPDLDCASAVVLPDTAPLRDAQDLAHRVQAYLGGRFGVDFAFDVEAARAALTRLDLWSDAARWQVIPPAAAVARLQEHWLARRTEHWHIARGHALPAT
jgi:hypothetical protein